MQDQAKPKRSFGLPHMPKKLGIVIVGVIIFLVAVFAYSVISRGGGKPTNYADLAAQATELARVSALVAQTTQDSTTKSLATTTEAVMQSNTAQIQAFLKKNSAKTISQATLDANKKADTDTAVATADQNGSLPTYYKAYLKDKLSSYQATLKSDYASAPPKSKTFLSELYDSSAMLSTNQ